MTDKRPQADRILIAEIWGEARRRARWRELSSDEEAAAVAELAELAAGRADLLAEVAGVLEGASEGEPDGPLARQAAQLCRKAGGDPDQIPAWIEIGRQRAARVWQQPFSGGLRGRLGVAGRGRRSGARAGLQGARNTGIHLHLAVQGEHVVALLVRDGRPCCGEDAGHL
ncbi:MAG: hypothetical protein ACRDOE_25750, partial [Streptosporangiaceae bacterium]